MNQGELLITLLNAATIAHVLHLQSIDLILLRPFKGIG